MYPHTFESASKYQISPYTYSPDLLFLQSSSKCEYHPPTESESYLAAFKQCQEWTSTWMFKDNSVTAQLLVFPFYLNMKNVMHVIYEVAMFTFIYTWDGSSMNPDLFKCWCLTIMEWASQLRTSAGYPTKTTRQWNWFSDYYTEFCLSLGSSS